MWALWDVTAWVAWPHSGSQGPPQRQGDEEQREVGDRVALIDDMAEYSRHGEPLWEGPEWLLQQA